MRDGGGVRRVTIGTYGGVNLFELTLSTGIIVGLAKSEVFLVVRGTPISLRLLLYHIVFI
jgi:hypothetical protein